MPNADTPLAGRRASLRALLGLALAAALPSAAHAAPKRKSTKAHPMIKLSTNFGPIVLELDAAKAPDTVANFVQYVKDGHYDGTIFHRVIDGFMIQGGGFTPDMEQKPTRKPIQNEADNGLKNAAYTLAMARTPAPHSASSQFFINVADNGFLDYREPTAQGYGYCVFGKVVEGQDTVDRIRKVPTGNRAGHQDVPREDVLIEKAEVLE
jgi:peptidyl-prolyl cis-trans isomerase B (cyclophilin B)